MWVRSQDKQRLLKANYVRKNGSFIEVVHSDMGCTLMGIYSTEEKVGVTMEKNPKEEYEEITNAIEDWMAICDFRDKEQTAWCRRNITELKIERRRIQLS